MSATHSCNTQGLRQHLRFREARACASTQQRQAQRSMQPRHTWLHLWVPHALPGAGLCTTLAALCVSKSNLAVQHLKKTLGLQP